MELIKLNTMLFAFNHHTKARLYELTPGLWPKIAAEAVARSTSKTIAVSVYAPGEAHNIYRHKRSRDLSLTGITLKLTDGSG